MDLVEVLSFLFMLSTAELGRVRTFCPSSPTRRVDRSCYQEYSTENLSDTQRVVLEDLRDYGLIWQRKAKARILHDFFKPLIPNNPGIVSSLQSNTPGDDVDVLTPALADSCKCEWRPGPRVHCTGDKLPPLCIYRYELHCCASQFRARFLVSDLNCR
jgi:Transcription factor Tfb2